jgi:hypothetical protein
MELWSIFAKSGFLKPELNAKTQYTHTHTHILQMASTNKDAGNMNQSKEKLSILLYKNKVRVISRTDSTHCWKQFLFSKLKM